MVEVQRAGQTQARYTLNAIGERVAKTIPGSPDQVIHFHYDIQGRLIAETDSAGAILREYIWLDDLPVLTRIHGVEYAVLADHLGTAHRLVDMAGTVVWDAVWRPFGEIDSLTATVAFPLRLPGQYFDAESGLHYNYQRDYDPALGRYLQADPIGIAGGANRYSYAFSNPISKTDPSGTIVIVEPRVWDFTLSDIWDWLRGYTYPDKVPGKYVCTARCYGVPTTCPPRDCPPTFGHGTGNSLQDAVAAAKKQAQNATQPGCRAKHCSAKCRGPRGNQIDAKAP